MKTGCICLLVFLAPGFGVSRAPAQGTAFTYQGALADGSGPVTGVYDFTFALFATNTDGVHVAGPVTNSATGVTNSLFVSVIDFGAGIFTGSNYWLEIGVRTNGGTSFTTLAPRQAMNPVPYAIFANTASNLLGVITVAQLGAAVASTNAAGALVLRDARGGFAAGTITVTNIVLPTNAGVVYDGTNTLILYNAINQNFFAGMNAGNPSAGCCANVGIGQESLHFDAAGYNNTGVGFRTLYTNIGGFENVAVGNAALEANVGGSENVAVGNSALTANTNGLDNTAVGGEALLNNINGIENIGVGHWALKNNQFGSYNLAVGGGALQQTISSNNTAVGFQALFGDINGSNNIALGFQAGMNINAGHNNIDIGNLGSAGDGRLIRIGTANLQTNTFIAGISGVTVANASPVVVSPSGQLGTLSGGITTNILTSTTGGHMLFITNGIIMNVQ